MHLRQATQSLLQLFFPQTCRGCGSDAVSKEQLLCITCLQRLPVTDFYKHAGNATEKMLTGRLPFIDAASHFFFTQQSLIQQLMHQFKYKGIKEIGEYFGKRMGEAIRDSTRFTDIDAIIPMPLHKHKLRQRKYNQAGILSYGIASVIGKPVLENIITRISAAGSQTLKNRIERWENIIGSFVLENADAIVGKHLLLVDDVITTGATLEACGATLLKAPGTSLSLCTLACAMK
ncbi:MAG: ComF family protein [Chitinophagaceae bacterium]|nr:ComF family protein [Chitinophagaceae bacterium]